MHSLAQIYATLRNFTQLYATLRNYMHDIVFHDKINIINIIYIMHKHANNHYIVMFFIMILSGLLSTMNIWADKWDDIRFSINDGYMVLLMTGWMFLFMGIFYKATGVGLFGAALILTNIWCIRNQFFISESQYKLGMIPHHSMAIHMSKKLEEKRNNIPAFLTHLIHVQENEIAFMKNRR